MSRELFMAIQSNDISRVESLLASGVDANEINDMPLETRPLHAAVVAIGAGADPQMIPLLIRHGADINLTCPCIGGGTPLQVAIFNEFYEVVILLLQCGADPNVRGEEGDSALRASMEMENIEIARILLKHGAARTIDSFGSIDGLTALGIAVSRLNVELTRLLLEAGADPKALDLDFETAIDHLPSITLTNSTAREQIRSMLSTTVGF